MRLSRLLCTAVIWAGVAALAQAAPIGYSIRSATNGGQLFEVDFATGSAVQIGAPGQTVGFANVDGLDFDPGTNTMYGVDDNTDTLIKITLDGMGGYSVTTIGVLKNGSGQAIGSDPGLAITDSHRLFITNSGSQSDLYEFTLAGVFVAQHQILQGGLNVPNLDGLAAFGEQLYAATGSIAPGGPNAVDLLYEINPGTGAASQIGDPAIGLGDIGEEIGLSSDSAGNLYGTSSEGQKVYQINRMTGQIVAGSMHNASTFGLTNLAMQRQPVSPPNGVPEPASACLWLGTVAALAFARRRAKA